MNDLPVGHPTDNDHVITGSVARLIIRKLWFAWMSIALVTLSVGIPALLFGAPDPYWGPYEHRWALVAVGIMAAALWLRADYLQRAK